MNGHAAIDRFALSAGAMYGDHLKFFRDGTRSISLVDLVPELEIEFPEPSAAGEYRIPVRYRSLEGTARLRIMNLDRTGRPVLIFHHGSGEHAYVKRIAHILPPEVRGGLTIAAVSIPFNASLKEYLHGIGTVERFCFSLAAAVRIAEALRARLSGLGCRKIVQAGLSLGGWITNLHAALYGTMDEYRPICAGAALDDLFTSSVYRRMLAVSAAGREEDLVRALNFEAAYRAASPKRVYPILARHDQYIRFDRQRHIFEEARLKAIDKGHITVSCDTKAQRDHLLAGFGPV